MTFAITAPSMLPLYTYTVGDPILTISFPNFTIPATCTDLIWIFKGHKSPLTVPPASPTSLPSFITQIG